MPSNLLLLALALAPVQSNGFQDVYVAGNGERIAFAHVVAELPTPSLAVFSETARLAVWPAGQAAGVLPPLAESERYVLTPDCNALGIVFHFYPCLEGLGLSRIANLTELRLPFGLPNGLPATQPPLPPPAQPIQVGKAAWVRMSERGNLVAFLDAGHHPDEPGRVQLFRRTDLTRAEFSEAGNYGYTTGGEFQVSAEGTVIAHAEGPELRLITAAGQERARLPLGGPFFLSPDGHWLARWKGKKLLLSELTDALAPPFPERSVSVQGSPLTTVFEGDSALVVTSERVDLFSLSSGALLWSRESPEGAFASGDLLTPAPGRLLIALGELDVLSPPMRGTRGRAHVSARVFELATDELLATSEFDVSEWVARHPHLTLLGRPPRLVVTTTERVQVSEPIP